MPRVDPDFKEQVYRVVKEIPEGKVASYGQISALCGAAWAAWEVGQIAHLGPADIPWHRVVNKKGGLASGYVPGGPETQRRLLQNEGITFTDMQTVKMDQYQWRPNPKDLR